MTEPRCDFRHPSSGIRCGYTEDHHHGPAASILCPPNHEFQPDEAHAMPESSLRSDLLTEVFASVRQADLARDNALLREVMTRVLGEVWVAIHMRRYAKDEGAFVGPDSFYAGVTSSAGEVLRIASAHGITEQAIYRHYTETVPLDKGAV